MANCKKLGGNRVLQLYRNLNTVTYISHGPIFVRNYLYKNLLSQIELNLTSASIILMEIVIRYCTTASFKLKLLLFSSETVVVKLNNAVCF